MNSTLGTTPSWALRTLLIVALLCLPLLVVTGHTWFEIQMLTVAHEQTHLSLSDYKRAECDIKEKLRRQRKDNYSTPIALQGLFPLGSVLSEDITLLTLAANFKEKSARLEIAATSLPALLDFTARVQLIPLQVKLQNHRMEKNRTQKWPVRATMNINLSAENADG